MDDFADSFPDRFIQIGVAEQNLASVASGMAAMGKLPVITSYAMFSPGRNWEQIRTTILYNDVQVIIAGSHAGVSVGPDGGTHQAIEDIALMRVLPNITVIAPCDAVEARKAVITATQQKSSVYLRLARNASPLVTEESDPFTIGKAQTIIPQDSPDVGIVACGPIVHQAVEASKALAKKGIKAEVLNMATIKPIDEGALYSLAKRAGAIVTAEEHQRAGGLGGAVAEYLSRTLPTSIEFIGVDDEFGQSGTPEELLSHYKLDGPAIVDAAVKVNGRKR
jgi:transketolase